MIFNCFTKVLINFSDSEALKPLLGILGLKSWSWDLWLGILGLGLGNWAPEAGGTPGQDPGEPSRAGYMHRFFKTFSKNPLGKPS